MKSNNNNNNNLGNKCNYQKTFFLPKWCTNSTWVSAWTPSPFEEINPEILETGKT